MEDQKAFKEQLNMNLIKEKVKDQNYRNFYTQCAQQQEKYINMHEQNVFRQKQQKDQQLNYFVDENMKKY